jgi:hypothetical protein
MSENDSDAKEWVTIKIPASVRNQARDDPRTYGQIMNAGLNNEPFSDDMEMDALFERLSALEDTVGANNGQREEFREELAAIRERLEELGGGSGVSYDDVRAACGAAVREELEDLR